MKTNWITENGLVYTRDQVDGAIPNGTRIMKINSEPTDTDPDGALGTVIGSIPKIYELSEILPHHLPDVLHGYWINWDTAPHVPAFQIDRKISRAD